MIGGKQEKSIGLVHTRYAASGGVENYINKLVPSLLERDWQVHYFTARIKQEVPKGLRIHKIPVFRGSSTARMLSFAYAASRAVKKADLPVVMGFGKTIHQDIYRDGSGCFLDFASSVHKRFNPVYARSFLHLEQKRYAHPGLRKVIAISQMVKRQILNRYPVSEDRIEVIYSGVDQERFNPGLKEGKDCVKADMHLPKDKEIVLFIGNDFQRKGLGHLIRALPLLLSDLPLLVLVAGKDKQAARYKAWAESLGCSEEVVFLGEQRDVASLYAIADVFVLPSNFDPFANVVMEALSSGTPVIVGNQVGAAEMVLNGENGYVLDDYAPESIAGAVRNLLGRANRQKIAERAWQSASFYSWKQHLDRLEEIFFEIVQQKKKQT